MFCIKRDRINQKKRNINIKLLYEAMQKLENFFECMILDLTEKSRIKTGFYD